MTRNWIWLQLILGWLPMGALFALLIMSAHGSSFGTAIFGALPMMLTAALLGVFVHRLTQRVPWPHPVGLKFVATHLVAAAVYAAAWFVLTVLVGSMIETIIRSVHDARFTLAIAIGPGAAPYLIFGVWLYIMVAGIAYANRAAERTAQIEAQAARAQLAALSAQLHPHLLFNALHTIVQLIPIDPSRATRAAEELAGILRTALSERRDVVTLKEEWNFVQRYLAIETLRFGERLRVREQIADEARDLFVPAFALQTLIENAVRHAAAPRAQTTDVLIDAHRDGDDLVIRVADDGPGAASQKVAQSEGTGLRRLRERLGWLCGAAATLEIRTQPGQGFAATLRLPQAAFRAVAGERLDHD